MVPILAITEVNDATLPAWYGKRPQEAGDRIFKLAGAAKGQRCYRLGVLPGIVMAEVEIAVKLKVLAICRGCRTFQTPAGSTI